MLMRQWTRLAVGVLIGTHAGCAVSDGGFVPIFDGKTLAGWRVVPPERSADWTVRDGAIVGTSESEGSYLVWHDDSLSDFELKLGYRFLTPGNTGVQVRSRVVESRSHPLYGYHADLGHVGIGPRVLGAWDFHGAPRGDVLVRRGQRVVIDEQGVKSFTPIQDAVTPQDIRQGEYNEMHVVARGHRLFFTINGKVASEVIDNEAAQRLDRGVIALQLHNGDRMTVEFRDLRIKRLTPQRHPSDNDRQRTTAPTHLN